MKSVKMHRNHIIMIEILTANTAKENQCKEQIIKGDMN